MSVFIVFDGASSAAKLGEDEARRQKREEAAAALTALQAKAAAGEVVSAEAMRKTAGKAFRRTDAYTDALQAALTANGFKWEVAPVVTCNTAKSRAGIDDATCSGAD